MFLIKALIVLPCLIFSNYLMAATLKTPKVSMNFVAVDGHPIEGVSLSAILKFESLTFKDCSGFICAPSLPYYVLDSLPGEVIGKTDHLGNLDLPQRTWSVQNISAKNLKVHYFTNGLIDVYCDKDKSKQSFAGYLEALPQYINGQPIQINQECTGLEFKDGDTKEIYFNCISPLTKSELEEREQQIKAQKCK